MEKKSLIICCDLGGVLITNNGRDLAHKYEKEYGLTKEKIFRAFDHMHKHNYSKETKESILKELNIDKTVWDSYIKNFWASEKRNNRLYKQLLATKKTFDPVHFVLTTNNTSQTDNILSKYKLDKFFVKKFVSSDVGHLKSTKEYWQHIIATLDSEFGAKDNVVIIDDNEDVISTVNALGLYGVLYDVTVNIEDALEPKIQALNLNN